MHECFKIKSYRVRIISLLTVLNILQVIIIIIIIIIIICSSSSGSRQHLLKYKFYVKFVGYNLMVSHCHHVYNG
jgi:hypothetical protein